MSMTTQSIGRVLSGRYRIQSVLGTGASAHVFAALDLTLARQVAVKVLHPALADDPAFLRRFRAEARAAAALNHPHVVSVYDWGEDDGSPYLVMQVMAGGSLLEVLDSATLDVAQAVQAGLHAASGLAYAHARGVVHRDIKPANLLFDEEGRLAIGDFGVARALAEAAWTEPSGATVGTARYASPEQALGRRVDGRCDVYALALVLFEAVTGSVPFSSDTTLSTLMARVGATLPEAAELGPLAPILRQAAAPDPADRMDARELARRLGELASSLPAPRPLVLAGGERLGIEASPPVPGPSGPQDRASESPEAGTDLGLVIREPKQRSFPRRVLPGRAIRATEPDSASAVTSRRMGGRRAGRDDRLDPEDAAEGVRDMLALAAAVGVADEEPADPLGERAQNRSSGSKRRHAQAPRRRRRWVMVIAVLALVLVAAGGGLVWAAEATRYFVPTRQVPSVLGMDVAQARAALNRDHFKMVVAPATTSSMTVKAGDISTQSPRAGTRLKEQSAIRVVLSGGPPLVAVPQAALAAITASSASSEPSGASPPSPGTQPVPCQTAAAILAQAQLSLGSCQGQPSTTVAEGALISWTPHSGMAPEGSAVNVVFSTGPPFVPLPSLSGITTCTGVDSAFSAAGLKASCTTAPSTTVAAGGVVSESPSDQAQLGSTVQVVLSSGPPMVQVPPIPADGSLSEMTAALQNAGLHWVVYGPPGGTVFLTKPSSGTLVVIGSTVALYVQ